MDGDFVCGFIQVMDAERDPRNLTIAFQLAQTIIKNFSLGVFVEEMFEVTSCYFPVDFKTSPKDPGSVTKEELELGVQGCMTGSSKFGPFCIPLLIEKLTSDIQSAKIASLVTLSKGCEVFGAECIREFTSTLFSCIKREVYSGISEQLTEAALCALTALVKTLSKGVTKWQNSQTYLSEFIKEILHECRRHLLEPDLRLITPSCKLLQSVASASDPACWSVLTSVLPTLLEQYSTHTQINQKRSILDNLNGFLQVTRNFTFTDEVPSPVKDYKSTILEVFASALDESAPSLRQSAVQGQITLLSLDGLLTLAEVSNVGDQAVKHLLTDQDAHVRCECVKVLQSVALWDVGLLKENLLPEVISVLQSDPMETDADKFVPTKEYLLNVLASLATQPQLLDLIVSEIFICLSSSIDSLSIVSAKCLSRISQENQRNTEIIDFMYKNVLPKLLAVFINERMVQGDFLLPSEELLTETAAVFRHITVTLDRRKAEELCNTVCELFVKGNTSVIPGDFTQHFAPLQVFSPVSQTRLVVVLQAVLCSLPKEVSVPDVISILQSLLKLSVESTDTFTNMSAIKCCAGLVNKTSSDQIESFLKNTQDSLISVLDHSSHGSKKHQVLNLWVWLTKALVLRGHALSSVFITKLLSLLENKELGLSAANGFLIIVSEFEDVMSSQMKSNIQMFYRQKLFIENINVLTEKFKNANEDSRSCYLLAISHLLRFLPKQVLLGDLKSLMPTLTQSLMCSETDLLTSTLVKLTELTTDAPDIIATYLDTLVPQLLRLAAYSSVMNVRIEACRCLNALTSLPTHVTLTHKGHVTRSLQRVLDDKKRLVRREAATSRGNWFLIGQPGH